MIINAFILSVQPIAVICSLEKNTEYEFQDYFTTLYIFTSLALGFSRNINFTLADPQPAINEVCSGSILSGDLDGDGDMDLIQSGLG